MIKETIESWSIEQKREAYKLLIKYDVMAFEDAPTFEEIVEAVLCVKGLTWNGIKAKCRKRPLAETRHIIYYFCHFYKLPLSLMQIGLPFDADHATVIYGIKKTEELIEVDAQINKDVKEIINLLTKKDAQ